MTEYTWGHDWLIKLDYTDRELSRLTLYVSKGGANTKDEVLSISGVGIELEELYNLLLFGTGASQSPAPGSLTYE